jgi:hypothetical protein
LTIGNRTIKRGKQISVSDDVYDQFKTKIDALAESGIIALTKTGHTKDGWKQEQLHAPAPPAHAPEPPAPEVKEEEPTRGVIEIDMSPADEPVEEPVVVAAPEPEPEEPKAEEPAPNKRASKKVLAKEDKTEEAPAEKPKRRGRRKSKKDD